ncbi:hypothetical protein JHK87_039909 [Glycine soja]|nr:hypothetical protein JHK87_039909 [Glycine soja]
MSHILPSPSHVHNSPPSLLDERPRHPTPLGPPPVQCHCFFHHPGPRLHPLDHDPTHLVYLLDHSCYLPPQHLRVLFGQFMDHSTLIGNFLPSSFDFQRKILLCFGLCEHTYVPQAMHSIPTRPFKATAREEAEQVMFGALDNLFSNTNDKLKDIRVLVINSSLFNPTPSLSAMMVNKYKLCDNIKSFNLGDMGYSTGVIIVDLVKDMLQFHCNTNAAIVSIDNITQNWYPSFMAIWKKWSEETLGEIEKLNISEFSESSVLLGVNLDFVFGLFASDDKVFHGMVTPNLSEHLQQ